MNNKNIITIQQIKAARALLDWKQSDLAKASGISLNAINNIERGIGSPRLETMHMIARSLEQAGIEFTDCQGVKLRGEVFQMNNFDGPGFIEKLTDDMLSELKHGDEVLMCGIDERLFIHHAKSEVERYTKAAIDLELKERILICEGDTYFASQPHAYRWVPRALFGKVPYLIYSEKVAIVLWNKPYRTIIMQNKSLVETFKVQFDFLWQMASDPKLDRQ